MSEQIKLLQKISSQLQTLIELQTANIRTVNVAPKALGEVIGHIVPASMIGKIKINSREISAEEVINDSVILEQLTTLYTDYADLITHENAFVNITPKGVFVNDSENTIHQVNLNSIMPESSYIQRITYIEKNSKYPQGAVEVKFKKGGAVWHYTPTKTCKDWYNYNVCNLMNSDNVSSEFHDYIKNEVKYGRVHQQRQTHLELVG